VSGAGNASSATVSPDLRTYPKATHSLALASTTAMHGPQSNVAKLRKNLWFSVKSWQGNETQTNGRPESGLVF